MSKSKEIFSVQFGEFGDYGAAVTAEEDDDGVCSLGVENWAYGDTMGFISIFSLTPEKLEELSKKLLLLADKVRKSIEVANGKGKA